ncbi:MAG: aa3-type cytochrome c oxidase subunit IV [Phyllobacteriaceae bacterium]|nr:aa3-type cytochrome c oxidase subunit IV [Phyllobacteriaceae bacterium]
MDYSEHERTYGTFLALTKYGAITCAAIMAGMAFGFFVGGWFSGLIVAILVIVAGVLIL